MQITPVSKGSATRLLDNWMAACASMSARIAEQLGGNEDFRLDGYLSTMMAFVHGLGSSPGAQKLQDDMGNFYLNVAKAMAAKPSNWESDLTALVRRFPKDLSENEIKAAFKRVLDSISQIEPDPASSPYAAGFQQSLQDLLSFSTPKMQQILTSGQFQNPLNAFIDEPDASNQKTLVAEINRAIVNL